MRMFHVILGYLLSIGPNVKNIYINTEGDILIIVCLLRFKRRSVAIITP